MRDNGYILDTSWNPVKVSPHGTIEHRGCDMNSFSRVAAASVMVRRLSKYIDENNIEIVPSSIGNSKGFVLEGKRLYVPEMEVINKLQKKSAFSGVEDDSVFNYCQALIKFSLEVIGAESRYLLAPFIKIIDERKTESDKIISAVKHLQGNSNFKEIEQETAQEIACRNFERIYKDMFLTKKVFDAVERNGEE